MMNLKVNLKVLGAVVIAAGALSSSGALAQAALSNPDACEAEFATCTGLGTGSTPVYRYRPSARRVMYRQPAAAAVAPVGSWGAPGVGWGTPGPGWGAPGAGWGNSYAMYGGSGMYGENGWYGNWSTYAARNGIVCRPGTYYKAGDGLMHLCQ